MRASQIAVGCIALTMFSLTTLAQEIPDAPADLSTGSESRTWFDPMLRIARQTRQRPGASVLIQFQRELSDVEVARHTRAGVRFDRRNDRIVHVGPVYAAYAEWDVLEGLSRDELVVGIDAGASPDVSRPLANTATETGARAVHNTVIGGDGEGVLVGVLDSGVDIFHPHFFFADGGAYDWIDSNANGRFDVGVDSIDFDGSGAADPDEKPQLMKPVEDEPSADASFRPASDWVYFDVDDDGRRSSGTSSGFSEDDPAYGEPLFVGDDANRNGVMDPGERFLLLETSKVRRWTFGNETYVRGENLIDAEEVYERDVDVEHGTQTSSALLGGQRPHRSHGMAPGAELLMYTPDFSLADEDGYNGRLAYLQDAIDRGARIVLHEWGDILEPFDGSTAFDAAIDAAAEQGVVQITPAGNLASTGRHIETTTADVPLELPLQLNHTGPGGRFIHDYMSIALTWADETRPTVEMVTPDGEVVPIPAFFGAQTEDGTTTLAGEFNTTNAGNGFYALVVFIPEGTEGRLRAGEWTIRLTGLPPQTSVAGRISDRLGAWSRGIEWADPTEVRGTIAYPAAANGSIAVAAYEISDDATHPGDLASYSSAGPRFGGGKTISIATPADAVAAAPRSEDYVAQFDRYGGTSSAGAHTAGLFAALAGVQTDHSGTQLRQAIELAARSDHIDGPLPDNRWGYGKIDLFHAIHDRRQRPRNQPPLTALETGHDAATTVLDAGESADPDGDPLLFRWDVDYDGQWDGEWTDDPVWRGEFEPGTHAVRLEVADAEGDATGRVQTFEVPEPPEPEGPDGEVDDPEEDESVPEPAAEDEEAASDSGCCTSVNSRPEPAPLLLVVVLMGLLRQRRRAPASEPQVRSAIQKCDRFPIGCENVQFDPASCPPSPALPPVPASAEATALVGVPPFSSQPGLDCSRT